ncbi:hypothetical protein B0H15DRAFT_874044 [Mycena belliarum]|uniref:C2H2-type domain-containing protein n=1 Tax=Mycena belliarum TaxID=1033014 RepID=A0AAD6UM08_9AGAR|nr:hypothetical protein B0H15DRAFT_874044 [Mycena belliae]
MPYEPSQQTLFQTFCHRPDMPFSLRYVDYPASPDREFSCDFCALSFDRQHDLKRHIETHSGEKPYLCDRGCGKSFTRKDALKRHQTSFPFCPPVRRPSMGNHTMRLCSPPTRPQSVSASPAPNTSQALHPPSNPGVKPPSSGSHSTGLSPAFVSYSAGPSSAPPYGSQYGDNDSYPTSHNAPGLTSHARYGGGRVANHDIPPMSHYAQPFFPQPVSAGDYPASPSRNYQCDTCALSFDRHHDLKRHKVTHVGERPYSCNGGCYKSFTRKDALKRHQLSKDCGGGEL